MKKMLFISLALLVGAGIVIGYKMAKGEGFSCCGWGGEKVDPGRAIRRRPTSLRRATPPRRPRPER